MYNVVQNSVARVHWGSGHFSWCLSFEERETCKESYLNTGEAKSVILMNRLKYYIFIFSSVCVCVYMFIHENPIFTLFEGGE